MLGAASEIIALTDFSVKRIAFSKRVLLFRALPPRDLHRRDGDGCGVTSGDLQRYCSPLSLRNADCPFWVLRAWRR